MMTMILTLFFFVGGEQGQKCTSPTFDGHAYKVVELGGQCWFAENLRSVHYANGDEIPYAHTHETWTTEGIGMHCAYEHDEAESARYGQLYNGYAVNDERGLCPAGWHVPTDIEWQQLEAHLGMSRAEVALEGHRGSKDPAVGTILKSKQGWGQANGTDDVGFAALPGGSRYDNGSFDNAGTSGLWWSSSTKEDHAYNRNVYSGLPGLLRSRLTMGSGMSVRCMRNVN